MTQPANVAHLCMCTYTCTHVYVHMCMYTCTHVYVHMHRCVSYTSVHVYIYSVCTHTYTVSR